MDISVCILTDKWHERLPSVLASYHECCSEILLGANNGFDIRQYPALIQLPKVKAITLPWQGYGPTKNALAAHAANDWIFSADSDEMADHTLQQALQQLSAPDAHVAFSFRRLNFMGNRPVKHGAWGRRKFFVRLYNRAFTEWSADPVHEYVLRKPGMTIIPVAGRLLHFTADNYETFARKSRQYATLAREARKDKPAAGWKKWIASSFTFLKEYLFLGGFLDGKTGFRVAAENARYTFRKYAR